MIRDLFSRTRAAPNAFDSDDHRWPSRRLPDFDRRADD